MSTTEEFQQLRKWLDRHLPEPKCPPGCSDCCGPVVCAPAEYDEVLQYAFDTQVKPIDNGKTICPWVKDNRCQVYPVRPICCRICGHVRMMTECEHGVLVTKGVEAKIKKELRDYFTMDYMRMLHEVVNPDNPSTPQPRQIVRASRRNRLCVGNMEMVMQEREGISGIREAHISVVDKLIDLEGVERLG